MPAVVPSMDQVSISILPRGEYLPATDELSRHLTLSG